MRRVALVAYPWASNFDEFEVLSHTPGLAVDIIRDLVSLSDAAAIILPGSRQTVASLRWLRSSGLAREIVRAADRGTRVVGVCGGMQLLGDSIDDPDSVESGGSVRGLGLLGVHTEQANDKTTSASQTDTNTVASLLRENWSITLSRAGQGSNLFSRRLRGRRRPSGGWRSGRLHRWR